MTAPNELIKRLSAIANTEANELADALNQAADLLQSQAERIAELEVIVASYGELDVEQAKHIACMESDLDTLRAQLEAIAATEPVGYAVPTFNFDNSVIKPVHYAGTVPLFTRPIPAQEPVLVVEKEPDYWSGGHFHEGSKPHIKPTKVWCLPVGTKLFTRPMPAQDVTELVEALEKLASLGNGDQYGNSDGNMIARDALAKFKGAK